MLIGQVAVRAGVRTGTIRFYERHRLLTPPGRSAGGYRVYSDHTVDEIAFIKTAQGIGFSLDEIRDILALGRGGSLPCARVAAACETHLTDIKRRMADLRAFRTRLTRTLKLAQGECGTTPEGLCQAILSGRRPRRD